MMRALIADDEPELARHLERELGALWPELEVVAHAANGVEALRLLAEHRPDVAFLDIRMPGLTGLEVAQRLTAPCRVVFVTAYDRYAVEAFEREAVDYLLKPISRPRLAKTVQRLRSQGDGQGPPLAELLARLDSVLRPAPRYLQWIRAGVGERVQLISVDEVLYFEASEKYTSVVTAAREFLIRTPLKELIEQLDPDRFWQVHRSTIVNLQQVESVHRDFAGRLTLTLKDHPATLTVSRSYAHLFRQM